MKYPSYEQGKDIMLKSDKSNRIAKDEIKEAGDLMHMT